MPVNRMKRFVNYEKYNVLPTAILRTNANYQGTEYQSTAKLCGQTILRCLLFS